MKRHTILKTVVVVLVAAAAITFGLWDRIEAAYGPMEQTQSQCLICDRERDQKRICGKLVHDNITTDPCSDWIDTFIPKDHEHIWSGHTHTGRDRWFGGTRIGCGGIATLRRIFEQRQQIGETAAQELVHRFHALVRTPGNRDYRKLDEFTRQVEKDPEALLKSR